MCRFSLVIYELDSTTSVSGNLWPSLRLRFTSMSSSEMQREVFCVVFIASREEFCSRQCGDWGENNDRQTGELQSASTVLYSGCIEDGGARSKARAESLAACGSKESELIPPPINTSKEQGSNATIGWPIAGSVRVLRGSLPQAERGLFWYKLWMENPRNPLCSRLV